MGLFKNREERKKRTDFFGNVNAQSATLEICGLFPKYTRTKTYKMRFIMSWCLDISLSCLCLFELQHNIAEQDWKNLTELLSFMATDISYLSKNALLLVNAPLMLDILRQLEQPIFKNYPTCSDKHIRLNIKYTTLLIKMYQYLVFFMIIIYGLKPFFTDLKTAIRFEAFELGSFQYPLHVLQMCALLSGCWNNTNMDGLAFVLIAIATAQFQVLSDKLVNVRDWAGYTNEEIDNGVHKNNQRSRSDKVIHEKVRECVIHHLAILKYAASLENLYNLQFLVQFASSVGAICNTWFQFMTAGDDVLNLMFLVVYSLGLAIQILIYCFYGNNLTLRSEEIRDACYHSEWYNCGPIVKKSLVLIMERAKRPTYLTAGKFTVLSLVAYTSIMQSSYSYFTLMNHMYGN